MEPTWGVEVLGGWMFLGRDRRIHMAMFTIEGGWWVEEMELLPVGTIYLEPR